MRRWLSLSLLLLLLSQPIALAELNPYRYLSSISVLQKQGDNTCSVTSINQEKQYFLVAAHCVIPEWPVHNAPYGPDVLAIDGKAAYVFDVDVDRDMAVMFVPGTSRPALKLAKQPVKYLDEVYMAGHPFGWANPTVFRGWVSSPSLIFAGADDFPFNKAYMILQLSGAPGNSGSSVVNRKLEVVSLVQISWGRSFEPVMGSAPYADLVEFAGKYFGR